MTDTRTVPLPVAWRYRHENGLGSGVWGDWWLCVNEPIERAKQFHIQYEPLYTADQLAAAPSVAPTAGHDWMAKHVNDFASHFLQRYEKQGSLREGLMYAFARTFQGVPASPVTAKEAANWPEQSAGRTLP